jgi:nitrogen PTS system EIIA component
MSFQVLDLDGVAEYLHLTRAEIEQRVKDKVIPFSRRGERIVFDQEEIDGWASHRILGMEEQTLVTYHKKSTRSTKKILAHEAILPGLIAAGAIVPAMKSKTRASILRDLVAVAETTGKLSDSKELLACLEAREALCSTAMPGGFAIPHPRSPDPWLLDASFLIVGRPIQEIFFGAQDGSASNLFFLLCCKDDRLHLHTLARLSLIAHKTPILDQLRNAPNADAMREALLAVEDKVLADMKSVSKH